MKILLISDHPHNKSFNNIISLKNEIKKYNKDVLELYFDDLDDPSYKKIINNINKVDSIIISLEKINLLKLMENTDIFNIIDMNNNIKHIYIYGANSIIKKIEKHGNKFKLFKRSGVSKTSKQFKDSILNMSMQ